jgi:NAD(P)-dependent dehydrogenase (short-subunit alcohol dehydrogenase family)
MSAESPNPTPPLVVVTGASTGIGAATAAALGARGLHVLAGVRRDADADAIRAANVEPVLLDITDATQVAALAARVAEDPAGRPLRALVNNAGIAINAPVEALPLAEWRRQFEVNLFGHVAMTQALLPALIAARGTVVNISSVGGRVALPTYGAYAGSKFALEAVSDALRRELAGTGVQVAIVEPGGVTTEMAGRGIATSRGIVDGMPAEQRRRYDRLMRAIMAQAEAFTAHGVPAADAGRIVADVATARRPRVRTTIGRDAAVITRLVRLLPDRALDRVLARDLRPHLKATAAPAG